MRRQARVAPATVTEFSQGQHRRKRAMKREGKPNVETVTPDQRLYKLTMKMAGGDCRRLEIRDETTIVIHNNPVR